MGRNDEDEEAVDEKELPQHGLVGGRLDAGEEGLGAGVVGQEGEEADGDHDCGFRGRLEEYLQAEAAVSEVCRQEYGGGGQEHVDGDIPGVYGAEGSDGEAEECEPCELGGAPGAGHSRNPGWPLSPTGFRLSPE